MRLVLATAVIVSHAWPLGGFGNDPEIAGTTLGTGAVWGFFAISGFLICSSRERTPLTRYLMRRFLRLAPGLWLCAIVTALVLAPVSVALGDGQIDGFRAPLKYMADTATLHSPGGPIATTVEDVPFPSYWDGSLWTLIYEVACYLILAVVFTRLPRGRATPLLTLLWASTSLLALVGVHLTIGALIDVQLLCELGAFFFAGALLWRISAHVSTSVWVT